MCQSLLLHVVLGAVSLDECMLLQNGSVYPCEVTVWPAAASGLFVSAWLRVCLLEPANLGILLFVWSQNVAGSGEDIYSITATVCPPLHPVLLVPLPPCTLLPSARWKGTWRQQLSEGWRGGNSEAVPKTRSNKLAAFHPEPNEHSSMGKFRVEKWDHLWIAQWIIRCGNSAAWAPGREGRGIRIAQ